MEPITTVVNRAGAGYTYYFGMIDGLLPSFGPDTLTLPVLLVSDVLVVDSNWRESEPADALSRVVETLVQRGIAKEVDYYESVPRPHADIVLAFGLGLFVEWWAAHWKFAPSEDAIEFAVSRPYEFLHELRGGTDLGRGKEPIPYDWFRSLLDGIFTYACLGTLCQRMFDPDGFLSIFMSLCAARREWAPIEGTSGVDWVVGVCSELLPQVPLCLSKDGAPTTAVAPWVDMGLKLEGQDPIDLDSTMRRLDDLIAAREASECRDLRQLYRETVAEAVRTPISPEFIQTRQRFHQQWLHARALVRRSLKPSGRLERWTDVLTVPGAIASVAVPLLGAIPVLTWIGTKAEKARALQEARRNSPWLAIAEQMGDVGVMVTQQFPHESDPSET